MSAINLLGMHQPGDTLLHRLGPAPKLIGLFLLSIVVVAVREPWLSLSALAVVIVLLAWARVSFVVLWKSMRVLVIFLVLLGAFHWWQTGPERAIAVPVGILALILAATVLTATTPTDDMLDTITRGLGPFRRIGVDPERVSLSFSLMLRAIPSTLALAQETRDAARARGLDRNVRALLTPLILRVVANARATGEALHARGVSDD